MNKLSRRGFLRTMAVGLGAAAGARLAGRTGFIEEAKADPETPALLCVFLDGGYNSLFCSADSLQGKFGVTSDNIQDLGNGLFVDKPTFGTMPAFALSHMATIGVRHGISDHDSAQMADWTDGSRSYALRLASAMGGDGAIKAAVVGGDAPAGPHPAEGGVSFQGIDDMATTIAALSGSTTDPTIPDRDIAAGGLAAAQTMSQRRFDKSPTALVGLKDGYDSSIAVLKKPIKPFSYDDLANAYGIDPQKTNVDDFTSQLAAAELMILSGANVVVASDGGWDSHGDSSGADVRDMMSNRILPPLNTFMSRMLDLPDRNVVVAIFGDFARSLPDSDHQPNLSATVIGKHVMVGTTGRTDGDVALAPGTPGAQQFWAYLSAALKTPTMPFGPNPHGLLL